MIRIGVNADEFIAELEREFGENVQGAVVEMKKRVARHIRSGAEERSPRGTRSRADKKGKPAGPLHQSWIVAVGQVYPTRTGFRVGNDAQAEEALRGLRPDQPVFVQSTSFKSGFFEHGTAKMAPRPIVAHLIEETKEFIG